MSFTTPDFADAAQALLAGAGYSVECVDPESCDGGWRWMHGPDLFSEPVFESESEAWASALADVLCQLNDMNEAAACVISRWSKGDLAEAVHALEMTLAVGLPGTLKDFLEENP